MTAKCPEKAAAKAAGLTTYNGAPCSKGHGTLRGTATGGCVECARITRRAAYRSDPRQRVAAREAMRAQRRVDPRGVRRRSAISKIQSQFGITAQQYEQMFDAQNGCCRICTERLISRLDDSRELRQGMRGTSKMVARVDHDHSTGAVRGLLCSDCNLGLGKFQDNEQLLLNAAGYLRESATPLAQPSGPREGLSEIEPAMGPRIERSRGNRRDELNQFI